MQNMNDEYSTDAIVRRLELALHGRHTEPSEDSPPPPTRPVERVVRGGRVLFYPAAEGIVRLVGLGLQDEWVCEFACREADFQERYLRSMERHILRKAGIRLTLVS